MVQQEDDVVNNTQDAVANIMKKKMTRRRALSTAGKVGVAVVGTAVVAGAVGYYGGLLGAPQASTATVTATKTVTATATTTASGSSTASSSTTSAGTTPYNNYPPYVASWPLDMRLDNPVSGLSGTIKSVMFSTISYQADTTIPNSRASSVLAALQSVYPDVTWTNDNPGALGGSAGGTNPVQTVLQAGGHQWDVCRGTTLNWMPLNYLMPLTDYFNAWEDKAQWDSTDIAAATYKGELYMLPDSGDVHAGWWRKDLFAAAGYGTFDPKTFEYTGTTPNQMNYSELLQAFQKITQQNSGHSVYASYIPNGGPAILGPWYVDNILRANGAMRYHGDFESCTIDLGNAPYYNKALDALTFLQQAQPSFTPGGLTLDLNALINILTSGQVAFLFGLDSNLDGQYAQVALSKVNPNYTGSATLRNAIQPSVGWSDGTPLDPKIPPAFRNNIWCGILAKTTNLTAAWEWMRAMGGFNSQLSLVGNAAGNPTRLDVSAVAAADPQSDLAEWVPATAGKYYTDLPINSSYGTILSTAYVNSFDAFWGGTGTPESCIEDFVNAATAGLQKANIPPASS